MINIKNVNVFFEVPTSEVDKNGQIINELDCYTKSCVELHTVPKYVSNYKAFICGDVIDVYSYEVPNVYGIQSGKNQSGKKSGSVKSEGNLNRSKKNLRRLINANVTGHDLFITLTYESNMLDIDKGKNDVKNFVKRWNYERKKENKESLKYVYVAEFQKRGAVHFHCLFFNVGYIANKDLRDLWGHGFVRVNKIDDVDNVGAYVVKYMQKDMIDIRLSSKDLYGRSRGLKSPIEINNPLEVCQLLEDNAKHIVYNSVFSNEYKGEINFCQINLKRNNVE